MNTRKNSKTCEKTFCPAFVKRQKNTMKRITAKLGSKLKGFKIPTGKKMEKEMNEQCIKGYCNPSCKGTLYESGSALPKSLTAEIKKKKSGDLLLGIVKGVRKQIFGKKTSVLKGDFYEKIPSKKLSELKKQGAISGCTLVAV